MADNIPDQNDKPEQADELSDDTIVRWTPVEGVPMSILSEIEESFDIELETEDAPTDAYKQLYEGCEDGSCTGAMPGDVGWEPESKYFKISFVGRKTEIDRAYKHFRELMEDYINSL